jgi:hypothetical protein
MEFWTIVIYFNVTPLNLANQQKTWRSSPVHCIREEAREVEEGEGRRERVYMWESILRVGQNRI